MKLKPSSKAEVEHVQLFRAGSVVSSLAGAFGQALRETRLTAQLGYLVAQKPELFCAAFGFKGTVRSISLEARHSMDRSDILVETTAGTGVIEAKVDWTDPLEQSLKYRADWRVLITEHLPSTAQKRSGAARYVSWKELADLLRTLLESRAPEVRFVSRDLVAYLEEHNMIRTKESVEIYARDVNEVDTLNMFLEARIYTTSHRPSSRLVEALYFAPCFGQAIATQHPGVKTGVSYLARIEDVAVADTWADFLAKTRELRGSRWVRSNKNYLSPMRDWGWEKRRIFLFLSKPRLVFNPPIQKDRLQDGSGFLGRQFFSFDDLFEAWGC